VSNSLVCVDTHVLIWGIKKEASPGQEAMIPRAERYLENLESEGATIMVPAVVLAEVLAKVPLESHPVIMGRMGECFVAHPFDAEAALEYSHIWYEWEKRKPLSEIPESELSNEQKDSYKRHIKADFMIMATAIVGGASLIVSHDPLLHKLAKFYPGCPRVIEIPFVIGQGELQLDS